MHQQKENTCVGEASFANESYRQQNLYGTRGTGTVAYGSGKEFPSIGLRGWDERTTGQGFVGSAKEASGDRIYASGDYLRHYRQYI